jgi:hypothetical protein
MLQKKIEVSFGGCLPFAGTILLNPWQAVDHCFMAVTFTQKVHLL